MGHAAMDVLVHVSWSTRALRMEFVGYLITTQRPAERPKELGMLHTEERRLKGKERHMMVVFSVTKCSKKK